MSARSLRRASLLGALLLVLFSATPAAAFEPKPQSPPIDYAAVGRQAFDAVVLRPLGFGATVIGAAAFVIAAPLAWYAVGIEPVWDQFVLGPADFTFLRPLGEF